MSNPTNNTVNYIDVYTRANAIADGVLIDLMQPSFADMVKQAGFRYPIAMTKTVFSRYVEIDKLDNTHYQDLNGRLWDILWMLGLEIKSNKNRSEVFFAFISLPNKEQAESDEYNAYIEVEPDDDLPSGFKLCQLKAVCGPNDDGKPCLTIMLSTED